MFKIKKYDLAGRISILHTQHGDIETPAYVPVIHPTKQIISTKKIEKMGFDLVITNAYITMKHYGDKAIKKGIHKIINFNGAIMTDSGGYQVLEYGDIEITPEKIADFQCKIGSDIAVPLDKPTGYKLHREKAMELVKHTLKVSKKTLSDNTNNKQIWVGPIQGSEHLDLLRYSAKNLTKYGFQMLAIGSPVELMESYKYKLLADIIITAKKQIPVGIPLHLFGAGHPLTISFAVALGCDTFDSASYVLYAKHDRYITDEGTKSISDISYFSCTCEICSKYTPNELYSLNKQERIKKIALHNLITIRSEINRVKEKIHEGRLWEYVIKKARSHPKLFEIISTFTYNSEYFIKTTPRFKNKAVFLFTVEDQFRPEIVSYHNMVTKFKTNKKIIVMIKDFGIKPMYLSAEQKSIEKKFEDSNKIQFCRYNPFLGIIPLEISDIYPAAHYDSPNLVYTPKQFLIFAKTWDMFFKKNKFTTIYTRKNDEFIRYFIKKLPKTITRKFLK